MSGLTLLLAGALALPDRQDRLRPRRGGRRTGDPERGHSAAWEFGAEIGDVYIRDVDVYANLAAYPHLKVAEVGPKTYGVPGREAGDPYMNCSVARTRPRERPLRR